MPLFLRPQYINSLMNELINHRGKPVYARTSRAIAAPSDMFVSFW